MEDRLAEARLLFLSDMPKERKRKPPVERVVVPWWTAKGFPDLASAIAVELDKAQAIVSPVVLPMGRPDRNGQTWPFDIRADAMSIILSNEQHDERKAA